MLAVETCIPDSFFYHEQIKLDESVAFYCCSSSNHTNATGFFFIARHGDRRWSQGHSIFLHSDDDVHSPATFQDNQEIEIELSTCSRCIPRNSTDASY